MATQIIAQVVEFYVWLIIAYVLMSWFPMPGVLADIHRAIAMVVEPYLGLFRRIVPALGSLDISPIVAILVLQFATRLLLSAI